MPRRGTAAARIGAVAATGDSPLLAGLGAGIWRDLDALAELFASERRFTPTMTAGEREPLIAGWRDALRRALLAHHG